MQMTRHFSLENDVSILAPSLSAQCILLHSQLNIFSNHEEKHVPYKSFTRESIRSCAKLQANHCNMQDLWFGANCARAVVGYLLYLLGCCGHPEGVNPRL